MTGNTLLCVWRTNLLNISLCSSTEETFLSISRRSCTECFLFIGNSSRSWINSYMNRMLSQVTRIYRAKINDGLFIYLRISSIASIDLWKSASYRYEVVFSWLFTWLYIKLLCDRKIMTRRVFWSAWLTTLMM